MEEFPLEEFAKVKSFSVHGKTIEFQNKGKTVTIAFRTEGELFHYLQRWSEHMKEKKGASGSSSRTLRGGNFRNRYARS